VDYFTARNGSFKVGAKPILRSAKVTSSSSRVSATRLPFWQQLDHAARIETRAGLVSGQSYVLPSGGHQLNERRHRQSYALLYLCGTHYAGDEVVGLAKRGHLFTRPFRQLAGETTISLTARLGEALNNQMNQHVRVEFSRQNRITTDLQVNMTKRTSHGVQFDLKLHVFEIIDHYFGARQRLGFQPRADNNSGLRESPPG